MQSGNATIQGSTVTITGTGSVTLLASQAAAGNYAAGSQTATFSVAVEAQTITFTQPTSPVSYGAAPITLSANATSGLSVTFSVVSGPATVTGNTLSITGAGTVVVAANQNGNADFSAAPAVTRSITVNMVLPAIGLSATPNPVLLQNNVTLTGTVSSTVSTPTGSVTFLEGSTQLGTAPVIGGIATLNTSSLTAGPDPISAVYSGDTDSNSNQQHSQRDSSRFQSSHGQQRFFADSAAWRHCNLHAGLWFDWRQHLAGRSYFLGQRPANRRYREFLSIFAGCGQRCYDGHSDDSDGKPERYA